MTERAPTLAELFGAHEGALGLAWRVAPTRPDAPVDSGDAAFPSVLVGHPNPLRPHAIEVIGRAERDHLERADPATARAVVDATFAAAPLCLVVADDAEPPAALVERARRDRVPVAVSGAESERVVEAIRYWLVTRLARRKSVHGVFIEVLGVGVLITGEAGVGKSEVALELVSRGHRLIADDAPDFYLTGPDVLEGSCPQALRDFLEVRGLGLVNVRMMFGETAVKESRRLRLVVHLEVLDRGALTPDQRLDGIRRRREILGVAVPEVTIPIAPGHGLAVLVETTVRNHIQRMNGYDPVEDFECRKAALDR